MTRWAIYGATGYSGSLAARHAVERGEAPLLLARSLEKLAPLASELGLEYAAVGLDDPAGLQRAITRVNTVVHAAGPFADTWAPMVEACFAARTNYLDITGEVEVMEELRKLDSRAREAGVALMPGVAFDVVPSDCLAVHLHGLVPDATHLTLGIGAFSRPSRGTAASAAGRLSEGSLVRRHGLLVHEPPASGSIEVDLGWDAGTHILHRLQWGDLATAHHSTGIANIETYLPLDSTAMMAVRVAAKLPWVFDQSRVQSLVVRALTGGRDGPSAEERSGVHGYVWAEVTDGRERRQARIRTPHPYTFTAMGMVECARLAAAGDVSPGFQTPGSAFGPDFVLSFEGTEREDLDGSD